MGEHEIVEIEENSEVVEVVEGETDEADGLTDLKTTTKAQLASKVKENKKVPAKVEKRKVEEPIQVSSDGGKVSVQVKEYLKCRIGVEWYEFFPDTTVKVPLNVKEVLRKRGVLVAV